MKDAAADEVVAQVESGTARTANKKVFPNIVIAMSPRLTPQ